jgi:hypothetical protein
MGAAQSGVEEDKKGSDWAQVSGKGSIEKLYSWIFARARGLNSVSLFFLD